MRKSLVTALLLAFVLADPAWAARARGPAKRKPSVKQSQAQRKVARNRPASRRRVRIGLVPHHKGVANLFWMTKPIEGKRQDTSIDGTVRKSIPLN